MSCEAARRDFDATIFDLDGVLIECDGDPQIFKSGKSSDPPAPKGPKRPVVPPDHGRDGEDRFSISSFQLADLGGKAD